jgi:hypothetical protein
MAMDRDLINPKKIKRVTMYKNLSRRFTVQSFVNCELLVIQIVDLLKMKLEFPSAFNELVTGAKSSLKKELMLKLEIIRISQLEEGEKQDTNHVRAKFTVQMLSGIQRKIFNSNEEAEEGGEEQQSEEGA